VALFASTCLNLVVGVVTGASYSVRVHRFSLTLTCGRGNGYLEPSEESCCGIPTIFGTPVRFPKQQLEQVVYKLKTAMQTNEEQTRSFAL
jgi:hypothetical protein